MKTGFSFLMIAILMTFFAACSPKGALNINGNISDAANLNIYFDKMTASGNARVITNTKANEAGKFTLNFEEKLDPAVYRLRVGAKKAYLMINDEDSAINITGNIASLSDNSYEITGSPTSSDLQKTLSDIGNNRANRKNIDDLVSASNNALTNAFLANQVYKASPTKLNVYKEINEKLKDQYPSSEYTKDFDKTVASIERTVKAQQKKYKFKVGDEAPEIVGQDPYGKTRKLSDLRGKVVLIDFWASWCGPCRKANPHVVEVYDKYNKDGFEVFSYSLDGIHPRQLAAYGNDQAKIAQVKEKQKQKWINAIKQDNLKWDTHASELGHWSSKGNKDYGVSSIPTTFLVGRDGKFTAINPRYNLEEAVQAAL